MVCWRCGCWVDRPTWLRVTGPSSARGWSLQRGPLLDWYTDGAADTWVVECRPNCEVTALLRGLRELRNTSELSWATVAEIDSLVSLAERVAARYEAELAFHGW